MKLIDVAKSYFDPWDCSKGSDYFRNRRVTFTNVDDDGAANFEVEGSDLYRVVVFYNGIDLEFECTCPYFNSGNNCKHVWAAILEADKQNIFDKTKNKNESSPHWKKEFLLATKREKENLNYSWPTRARPPRHYAFAINADVSQRFNQLRIDFYFREPLKKGGFGAWKPAKITRAEIPQAAEKIDQEILWTLVGKSDLENYYSFSHPKEFSSVNLISKFADEILSVVSENKKLFLLENHFGSGRNLKEYKFSKENFELTTKVSQESKDFLLSADFNGRPLTDIIALTDGFILFRDQICPTQISPGDPWIKLFTKNPSGLAIPKKEIKSFIQAALEVNEQGFPMPQLPQQFSWREIKIDRPGVELTIDDRSKMATYTAKLKFLYENQKISSSLSKKVIYNLENHTFFRRDLKFESEARSVLLNVGAISTFEPLAEGDDEFIIPPGQILTVIDGAIKNQWRVFMRQKQIKSGTAFNLELKPSGIDWFELETDFKFDGVSTKVLSLLENIRMRQRLVELSDGSLGILPEEWLKRLYGLQVLEDSKSLRLNKIQALLLSATLPPGPGLNDLQNLLNDLTRTKIDQAPSNFLGELRSYQRQGLFWLRQLHKNNIGGILADDMGLGKTIQVISLFCGFKPGLPNLMVVPKSLIFNWENEFKKFAPHFKVLAYTGAGRNQSLDNFSQYDHILMTYQTLRFDIDKLKNIEFNYLVLDEAHYVKNSRSQTHMAIQLINSRYRLALTGTPIENSLNDLFALLALVNPGLASSKAVQRWVKAPDTDALNDLARAVRPFILRRTKEEVLNDLPEKSEQVIYCELSSDEMKEYELLKKYYWANLSGKIKEKGFKRSKIEVLEALLRLRQAACHYGLLEKKYSKNVSAKFEVLLNSIENAVAENHKVLVFSLFTSLLGLLKPHLKERGLDFEYLDGRTKNREEIVNRFQTSQESRIFLLSLKAGGVGLNLTAADYVFILDPWWNPAAEKQAIDRTHRIGQTKKVFSYKLISKNTVEEKILKLQQEKNKLAEAVLTASAASLKNLTLEDLQILFE